MQGSPRSIWLSLANRAAGWWSSTIAATFKRKAGPASKLTAAKAPPPKPVAAGNAKPRPKTAAGPKSRGGPKRAGKRR